MSSSVPVVAIRRNIGDQASRPFHSLPRARLHDHMQTGISVKRQYADRRHRAAIDAANCRAWTKPKNRNGGHCVIPATLDQDVGLAPLREIPRAPASFLFAETHLPVGWGRIHRVARYRAIRHAIGRPPEPEAATGRNVKVAWSGGRLVPSVHPEVLEPAVAPHPIVEGVPATAVHNASTLHDINSPEVLGRAVSVVDDEHQGRRAQGQLRAVRGTDPR